MALDFLYSNGWTVSESDFIPTLPSGRCNFGQLRPLVAVERTAAHWVILLPLGTLEMVVVVVVVRESQKAL